MQIPINTLTNGGGVIDATGYTGGELKVNTYSGQGGSFKTNVSETEDGYAAETGWTIPLGSTFFVEPQVQTPFPVPFFFPLTQKVAKFSQNSLEKVVHAKLL